MEVGRRVIRGAVQDPAGEVEADDEALVAPSGSGNEQMRAVAPPGHVLRDDSASTDALKTALAQAPLVG